MKKIVSAVMVAMTIMASTTGVAKEYSNGVSVKSKFDFDFSMTGPNTKFPNQVFTDGKKTWLQFKDLNRPPVIFADEKPIAYQIEGQYMVVSGIYPNITLVDGREGTLVEINYDGVYSAANKGVIHSVSRPIAINGVASLPQEAAPAPVYRQVSPSSFKVAPVTTTAIEVTAPNPVNVAPQIRPTIRVSPQSQRGWIVKASDRVAPVQPAFEDTGFQTMQYQVKAAPNFKISPDITAAAVFSEPKPVVIKVAQVKPAPAAVPVAVAQTNPEVFKMKGSFMVATLGDIPAVRQEALAVPKPLVTRMSIATSDVSDGVRLSDDVLEKLTQYVLSGYKIFITGTAGTSTEVSRVARANGRAVNAMKEIVNFGIGQKSVSVTKLSSYPSKGDGSGVEIRLVKS